MSDECEDRESMQRSDRKIEQPVLGLVVPAYNEESTIHLCLSRILSHDFIDQIVVVDDGSTDLTVDRVMQMADDRIEIVRHSVNLGKGAAIQTGLSLIRTPYVGIQDADLEYDPADLERLLIPLVDDVADVVYGSRFLTSEARRVLYFWHSVGNKALTMASNMASNVNLSDMETCYKVFKSSLIERICVEEPRFGVEPELTAKFAAMGVRINEVGIGYQGRTYSEGKKIGWKDGFSALRCIGKYNWRERRRVRRRSAVKVNSHSTSLHASLDHLSSTPVYVNWILDLLRPGLKSPVLEVGAGQGTFTDLLAKQGLVICAVEPDPVSFRKLEERTLHHESVSRVPGTTSAPAVKEASPFASAILVNVLEHIENDKAELSSIRSLLEPGGVVVVFVPAHEFLFSKFDLNIGHFRRYSRRELIATLHAAGFTDISTRYVNSIGVLAWGLSATLLRMEPTQKGLSGVYDKFLVPSIMRFEERMRPFTGQSILAIARNPFEETAFRGSA